MHSIEVIMTPAELTEAQTEGILPSAGTAIKVVDNTGAFIEYKTSSGTNSQPTTGGSQRGRIAVNWTANTPIDGGAIYLAPVAVGGFIIGEQIYSATSITTGAVFDATEASRFLSAPEDTTVLKKADVIDNLTAGGTAKVLSAEQGKVLDTEQKVISRTKANITENIWTPDKIARAIDIDFEILPAGNVSSVSNTGSLGGIAAQTTTDQQPIVSLDAAGRMGANFDGTNDWLESSIAWQLGGTGYGIFAVFRYDGAGGYLIAEEYSADDVLYTLGFDTASNLYVGHFNGIWRKSNTAVVSAGDLIVAIGNYDGVNFNIRTFGNDNLLAQTSSPDGLTTLKTRIGRRWDGVIGLAGSHFKGRIFRLLVKSGAFTASEINSLEAWAVRHFGLETKVLRPVNHTHPTATASVTGLMSSAAMMKLDGMAAGAEVNVQADYNQTVNTSDDFIKNKPALGTASALNAPATGNAGVSEAVKGSDTRLSDARTAIAHTHAESEVTNLTTNLAAKEATANKGAVNGYAGLDAGGRVPQAQLPTLPFGFELIDPVDIIPAANLAIFLQGEGLTAGAVATWANPGTGGDFTQATGGSQPTAELIPTLGGRMAVKFDGIDDWMSALSISLGTRYGLFAVIRTGGAITANGHILSKVYPNHVDYSLNAGSNFEGDGAEMGFAVGHYNGAWRGHGSGIAPVINTPYIFSGMYDGASFSITINGGTATTKAETSNPIATETTATMLGRRWDNTVAAANIWNGHIAALVCKSGAAFTADELEKLVGWSAWFYGLASLLPAGHRFKSFPPLIAA